MKKVAGILTNKYFMVGVVFLLWVMFFDQNDWMTLRQRQKELDNVKDNIAYLNSEIKGMESEKNALIADYNGNLNNPEQLEKYARERYRMKYEGEDVYVIEK